MTQLFTTRVAAAAMAALICLTGSTVAQESPDGVWRDVDEESVQGRGERSINASRYRTVYLDWPGLGSILQAAPLEGSAAALAVETMLTLPLPDGEFARFRIEESPIMEPDLAAQLPDVKTFRGFGLDDPSAYVRFDTTPSGFHAMIRSAAGTVFIDPYARGETDVYMSYDRRDFVPGPDEVFECGVEGEPLGPLAPLAPLPAVGVEAPVPGVVASGATFKQIRLAVAATGEYTGYHGGTVAGAQAAITTTINRVNVVYEHDLAIRMNLVNNTAIVYTNAGTDPYSNTCSGAELNTNQANLDTVLGAANYDLGHVVAGPPGGGGIAGQGPCLQGSPFGGGNSHAMGCTGTSTPQGDPFDIDFVAHEIGHQWGAPHTFNGSAGACGGNRSSSAAYEPGSGSTIMAYAGICAPQNLQTNSDDYFHGSSLETIANYNPTDFGFADCIGKTASGNTPPTANAGVNRTIPRNTPFTLCGSATDPDAGDTLQYLWEEYDLGADPGGAPNNPSAPPFFRSFKGTTSPCRTFPKLPDILANTQTNGEILPNVATAMKFRLTVFDNHPGGMGGGFDQKEMTVTVDGASGPFRVSSPNTATTWPGGSAQTVTWDVAGSSAAPVSCANVAILFSTDGGQTFPTTVLASTPNDGTQAITVPSVNTTSGRIKVMCADSVFFDINDANLTVTPQSCSAGIPNTLDLSAQESGTVTRQACQRITVKNGFSMAPGANVTLQSGVDVVVEDGAIFGDMLTVLLSVP